MLSFKPRVRLGLKDELGLIEILYIVKYAKKIFEQNVKILSKKFFLTMLGLHLIRGITSKQACVLVIDTLKVISMLICTHILRTSYLK